jgi:hypothetical protein
MGIRYILPLNSNRALLLNGCQVYQQHVNSLHTFHIAVHVCWKMTPRDNAEMYTKHLKKLHKFMICLSRFSIDFQYTLIFTVDGFTKSVWKLRYTFLTYLCTKSLSNLLSHFSSHTNRLLGAWKDNIQYTIRHRLDLFPQRFVRLLPSLSQNLNETLGEGGVQRWRLSFPTPTTIQCWDTGCQLSSASKLFQNR